MAVMLNSAQRVIKAPVNPYDKCTVVSIFPQEVKAIKHTIFPGSFKIPPGRYETPATLVIGPSSWWREVAEGQPLLEIPVSSIQVADSICKDWSNGILACDMAESMPGLFYLPGVMTADSIIESHKAMLDVANRKQKNWYSGLVRLADALWSKANNNPVAISDTMRLAARELGLDDRPWLADFSVVTNIRCAACQSFVSSSVIVCPNCKVILRPEEFKKLNLQFANQ